MNPTGHHHTARLRYLAAAAIACAGLVTATAATAAAAAGPGSDPVPRATAGRTSASAASVHTIHLVAHEKQRKFFNNGGFGDEEIFRGMPGGQITVQGFLSGTQSPIVHAITGGTGSYTGAEGEFSFTSPSPGVLDMTLRLLGADQQ